MRRVLFILACSFLVAQCSTVSSRIDHNRDKFVDYPPETQSKIENGDIDKGFTEEMVYMAKGTPSEKSVIRRANHDVTLWKYALPYPASSSAPAPNSSLSPYGYPTFGPQTPTSSGGTASGSLDRAYYIVEFENGKVTGWSNYGTHD